MKVTSVLELQWPADCKHVSDEALLTSRSNQIKANIETNIETNIEIKTN